uniref:D-sedoheptulose-7-phosphate isomerase n=1 Tax=uncultured Draconibacterium sp. TaxID=1573823 RepID=UPI0032163D70
MNKVRYNIKELATLTSLISDDAAFIQQINQAAEKITNAYKKGGKTIFCGNGGSAAEAQHLAAELSGRFKLDRKPLAAEACHVNSSFVTAISNDYDFKQVYSRYIEAFGNKGDVLVGLSTSGTSENIVTAFKTAQKRGLVTIALTGSAGGLLPNHSDLCLKIPSDEVPRIQEIHLLIGHIICEKVEHSLFGDE